MEKGNFCDINPDISGHFFLGGGVRGEGILFVFSNFVVLEVLLRFNNRNIRFYHMSINFLLFSKRRSKGTQILNFSRLTVCQFLLDFNKSDLGFFYLYL